MKTILIALAAINANFNIELNPQETKCIATAIYHEARGEPVMGQAAVGYVINNRVFSDRYPDTACGVVYQPWQFSHIETAKPDYNSEAWKQAVEVAAFTQVGLIEDETDGATMYYAHGLVTPKWDFTKLEFVGELQGHKFYKEV